MKRQGGYDVCRTKFKLFSRGMTKTSLSSQMLPLSNTYGKSHIYPLLLWANMPFPTFYIIVLNWVWLSTNNKYSVKVEITLLLGGMSIMVFCLNMFVIIQDWLYLISMEFKILVLHHDWLLTEYLLRPNHNTSVGRYITMIRDNWVLWWGWKWWNGACTGNRMHCPFVTQMAFPISFPTMARSIFLILGLTSDYSSVFHSRFSHDSGKPFRQTYVCRTKYKLFSGERQKCHFRHNCYLCQNVRKITFTIRFC